MSMTHIETYTAGSAVASIEFTSIPQTFTDLMVLLSARSDRSGNTTDYIAITFNADTTNYSTVFLVGDGSSPSSSTGTAASAPRIVGQAVGDSAVADTFANNKIYISNYTKSNSKSFSGDASTENNISSAKLQLVAGLWNDTDAITSLKLEPLSGGANNFVANTTASLYGISAGGSGTVGTA